MNLLRSSLLAVLSLILFVQPVSRPPATNMAQKAYDATVAIFSIEDGKVTGGCTASVIEKESDGYLLLTAKHCVVDDETGKRLVLGIKPELTGSDPLDTDTSSLIPVTGVAIEDDQDLAIVKIVTTQFFPVLELGDSDRLTLDSHVFSVGVSEIRAKMLIHGTIESLGLKKAGDLKNPIFIEAPVVSGDSGSAVIDEAQGKVVAVMVADWAPQRIQKSSMAVPIADLQIRLPELKSELK